MIKNFFVKVIFLSLLSYVFIFDFLKVKISKKVLLKKNNHLYLQTQKRKHFFVFLNIPH